MTETNEPAEIAAMIAAVEAICRTRMRLPNSPLHGLNHLRDVAMLAGRIAAAEGTDVEAAVVGGFLHDCARVNDGGGNQHAIDSAALAQPVLAACFPHLPGDRICRAILLHADGQVTADPLEGAIWDADRLTLGRAGIALHTRYFSTATGKSMARKISGS